MLRRVSTVCLSLLFAGSLLAAADTASSAAQLSAAEIVNRNVAARGGLQAWKNVQTLSFTGKMGAGGNRRSSLAGQNTAPVRGVAPERPAEEVQLPFVMDLKRTRKMRLELRFNGQTALQVYDGTNGWKVRPFLNRNDVESYTPDELKTAALQADLDGPLVDYVAKGTQIALDGTEKIDGVENYRLKLTMKNGQSFHLWVNSQTFLETKSEGQPRRLDGVMHPVEIYYLNYQAVNGLQIPFVLETRVLPVAKSSRFAAEPPTPAEKITIEKVAVNPKLDDALFTKPQAQGPAAVRGAKVGR